MRLRAHNKGCGSVPCRHGGIPTLQSRIPKGSVWDIRSPFVGAFAEAILALVRFFVHRLSLTMFLVFKQRGNLFMVFSCSLWNFPISIFSCALLFRKNVYHHPSVVAQFFRSVRKTFIYLRLYIIDKVCAHAAVRISVGKPWPCVPRTSLSNLVLANHRAIVCCVVDVAVVAIYFIIVYVCSKDNVLPREQNIIS